MATSVRLEGIKADPIALVALALSGAFPIHQTGEILQEAFAPEKVLQVVNRPQAKVMNDGEILKLVGKSGISETDYVDMYSAHKDNLIEFARVMLNIPRNNWISVEDHPPPKHQEVMVWPYPTDYCMTAEFRGDCWMYCSYIQNYGNHWSKITVTHWMHIPPPPQEIKK